MSKLITDFIASIKILGNLPMIWLHLFNALLQILFVVVNLGNLQIQFCADRFEFGKV